MSKDTRPASNAPVSAGLPCAVYTYCRQYYGDSALLCQWPVTYPLPRARALRQRPLIVAVSSSAREQSRREEPRVELRVERCTGRAWRHGVREQLVWPAMPVALESSILLDLVKRHCPSLHSFDSVLAHTRDILPRSVPIYRSVLVCSGVLQALPITLGSCELSPTTLHCLFLPLTGPQSGTFSRLASPQLCARQ